MIIILIFTFLLVGPRHFGSTFTTLTVSDAVSLIIITSLSQCGLPFVHLFSYGCSKRMLQLQMTCEEGRTEISTGRKSHWNLPKADTYRHEKDTEDMEMVGSLLHPRSHCANFEVQSAELAPLSTAPLS